MATSSGVGVNVRWVGYVLAISGYPLIYKLGAVITQGNRPITFFSRKLSKVQAKYSVTKINSQS